MLRFYCSMSASTWLARPRSLAACSWPLQGGRARPEGALEATRWPFSWRMNILSMKSAHPSFTSNWDLSLTCLSILTFLFNFIVSCFKHNWCYLVKVQVIELFYSLFSLSLCLLAPRDAAHTLGWQHLGFATGLCPSNSRVVLFCGFEVLIPALSLVDSFCCWLGISLGDCPKHCSDITLTQNQQFPQNSK